jgi:F0F1-type ATP synthase membrane subunit b/b'
VVVHDNQKKIAEKLDKIKKDNGKSQDTMSDIETVLREALQKIEEHNNNADTD